MKYQADSAMVAKKKSRGSQEAWFQGGNDDPSQQLLHCSSNLHPRQNVQPFWTSQVSFKERWEKKKGRERKKQTSWKDKVGGFFPHLLSSKGKQELHPVTAFYPSKTLNLSTEIQ